MIGRLLELLTRRIGPEVIGPPECPLIHRWTIGGDDLVRDWPVKLMVHRFLPHQRDRDPHDHPRSFLTIVVAGEYIDEGLRPAALLSGGEVIAPECGYTVKRERMRAGSIRFRRADHLHRTATGAEGAWTLVLMGPHVRAWGFVRDARWWPFREYTARFGHGMRCE